MNQFPKVAEDIEINQVEDGYVVYQAQKDRVHYLNHTAVIVLESCTGKNSEDEIATIVHQAFGLDQSPQQEVKNCIASMRKEGIIQ